MQFIKIVKSASHCLHQQRRSTCSGLTKPAISPGSAYRYTSFGWGLKITRTVEGQIFGHIRPLLVFPLASETVDPINQSGCDFLSSLGRRRLLTLVSHDPRESFFSLSASFYFYSAL